MTTDTLAEAVLGEAEAIVCAEWMRLQHSALREEEFIGPHAEMPAARPRPPRVATLTTTLRPPGMTHCGHKGGWPARWWPGLPVWATQRSPPAAPRGYRKVLSSNGGDAISDEHEPGSDSRAVHSYPITL